MKLKSLFAVLLIGMFFVLFSCTGNKVPEPLERAIQAAEQMTSPGMLEKSAFYAIFPNGSPKQFISFIFSDIGASEMPPVEGSGELHPDEEASMRSAYMPIWPAGVKMTHSKPNPSLGMQVVWKWNDAKRTIILEGYSDPEQPPVVVREVGLPIVQPSELARVAAQSNIEMGARVQAFE
jgi:hypothetical protein